MFNQYAQWEAEQQLETWTAAEWQHHQWEEQQQQASPPVQQQLQQQQEQQQEQQVEQKHDFTFFTATNPTVGWPSSSIMTVLASASTSTPVLHRCRQGGP
jgi:transcription initiation factor TFIID subunit TAF12